jgi:hypothetical protein
MIVNKSGLSSTLALDREEVKWLVAAQLVASGIAHFATYKSFFAVMLACNSTLHMAL